MITLRNPQNLYLYTISGIGVGAFFRITLPFVLVSFFLLLLLCFLQGNTSLATQPQTTPPTRTGAEKQHLSLDGAVFSLPAGSFPHPAHSAAVGVVTGVVSAVSKGILKRWILPAAHVCIFLYPDWESGTDFRHTRSLQALLYGREVLVSFLSCQLISNVPAAVLLSEFTDRYDLLLAGVNIGVWGH